MIRHCVFKYVIFFPLGGGGGLFFVCSRQASKAVLRNTKSQSENRIISNFHARMTSRGKAECLNLELVSSVASQVQLLSVCCKQHSWPGLFTMVSTVELY